VGGLGGSTLLRAYLSEAVTARDLVEPGLYSMPEVLGPSVVTFARPELSVRMLPPPLRGDEVWCQGFSEPGTGSNLASLTCRAVRVKGMGRQAGAGG
jgi:alkylation response protein AidB-like acyl-CoA dehydrogenase